MSVALVTALFWIAVASALVAQAMILRSTARVLRAAAPKRPAVEWGFAIGPALLLLLVLFLSWRAAMRPATVEVELAPLPGEVRL